MSLFAIAWRSIRQRTVASLLTTFSMALGVMLVVAVLSIHGVISASFRNNASLGYNMIVGAKGGKLQLTLNTVYYLSQPVENIPYSYYLEFLTAEQRKQLQADPGEINLDRDGKFGPYTDFAIPLCLGDYVGPFRSVGTTPDFFEKLKFGAAGDRQFEFAQGRAFLHDSPEHGFFEAVPGAVAAKELGLKIGDRINPTHGDPDGHTHAQGFTIVGILKPSGTPNDRAVFVNMEGFYLLSDHAKPVQKEEEGEDAKGSGDAGDSADSSDGHSPDGADAESPANDATDVSPAHDPNAGHSHGEPLAMDQREVTALLVRIDQAWAPGLHDMINEGREAQAVLPVLEIFHLFEVIVRPIQTVLLALTAMICIVSGISILVSIYNSMSERRHEIAVMRALGASRGTVMTIILFESVFLSLGGGAAGWLLAHTLSWLASPLIEAQTGVAVRFWDIRLTEFWLIPSIILLAVLCGLWPAVSAYRTDVAESLSD